MSDWGILFVLLGEVVVLTRIDHRRLGTWITPFSLLAVPYVGVVALAYCFAPALGFLPLVVESVWVWVGGLFLFWIGAGPVTLLFGKVIRDRAAEPLRHEEEMRKPALVLAWLAILVVGYALRSSLGSLGWQLLGSDEFGGAYGYGLAGHVSCFSMGLAVYLIGTGDRTSRLKWATVFVLTVLYLAYPTKAWVIIPILAGLLYRASSGRGGLSLRRAALTPLLVYVLFVVAYMVALGVNDARVVLDPEIHGFLATHFLSYLFAGVLAFGNVMQVGLDRFVAEPTVIVAPLHNLLAVLLNGPIVGNVTQNFSVISQAGAESNVNTYFGTIVINLGWALGVVYVVLAGAAFSGLFALSRITRNCWVTVSWVFTGALLSLGWFDFYFATLQSLELPVYFLIMGFLSWLVKQRTQRVAAPSPS